MVIWALCVIVAGLIISWGCKNVSWSYLSQLREWGSRTLTFTGKFVLGFFHDISRFKGQEKKGEGISLTTHYHFHPLHRHLDISRAMTAESLPLHIASSRTQTRNLIYTYVILIYKYIAYIMSIPFFKNFAFCVTKILLLFHRQDIYFS